MMTFGSISRLQIKALAAAFVGLHVPLVGLAAYGMMTDFGALLPVLLVALVSTLVGVGGTLFALFHILGAQTADAAPGADRDMRLRGA
jgi:hypothetical protein